MDEHKTRESLTKQRALLKHCKTIARYLTLFTKTPSLRLSYTKIQQVYWHNKLFPQFPDSQKEWLWLECGVFPGRLEETITKLFLLPCTGSKMRTIKFDTIHRAFTGLYNTWLGRQNTQLKKRLAEFPSCASVSIFLTPPGYLPNKEHWVAVGPLGLPQSCTLLFIMIYLRLRIFCKQPKTVLYCKVVENKIRKEISHGEHEMNIFTNNHVCFFLMKVNSK